jgi:hypothetical protein
LLLPFDSQLAILVGCALACGDFVEDAPLRLHPRRSVAGFYLDPCERVSSEAVLTSAPNPIRKDTPDPSRSCSRPAVAASKSANEAQNAAILSWGAVLNVT